MKKNLVVVAVFVALFVSAQSVFAFGELGKAKDYIEVGTTDTISQAIDLLKAIVKESPKNAEAHFLLGKIYLDKGYSNFVEEFRAAVISDGGYRKKIGQEYYRAANHAGSDERTFEYLVNAFDCDSSLANGMGPQILAYAERAKTRNSALALSFYDLALKYGADQKAVAKGWLYLAVNKYNTEELKSRAKAILGEEIIKKVFEPKVVFEKTYTNDDAFDKKYGQILTFQSGVDDIQLGDYSEVIVERLDGKPFSGDEIGIYRGENFTPKWYMTEKGYFLKKIENLPTDKYFAIGLNERKDVKVKVRVLRPQKENESAQLIDSLE